MTRKRWLGTLRQPSAQAARHLCVLVTLNRRASKEAALTRTVRPHCSSQNAQGLSQHGVACLSRVALPAARVFSRFGQATASINCRPGCFTNCEQGKSCEAPDVTFEIQEYHEAGTESAGLNNYLPFSHFMRNHIMEAPMQNTKESAKREWTKLLLEGVPVKVINGVQCIYEFGGMQEKDVERDGVRTSSSSKRSAASTDEVRAIQHEQRDVLKKARTTYSQTPQKIVVETPVVPEDLVTCKKDSNFSDTGILLDSFLADLAEQSNQALLLEESFAAEAAAADKDAKDAQPEDNDKPMNSIDKLSMTAKINKACSKLEMSLALEVSAGTQLVTYTKELFTTDGTGLMPAEWQAVIETLQTAMKEAQAGCRVLALRVTPP